jgi:hypothetical protein
MGRLMLLYLAIFLLGFLFLVITFVAGEVFDFLGDHLSHDGDPSHALSGKTIAAGMTAFGATGMITRVYHFGTGLSVIVSLLAALSFGALIAWLMGVIYQQTASSNVSTSSLRGHIAEVTIGIPVGSFGEVLLASFESTRQLPARSSDGSAIPAGSRVRVVETLGNVVVVEPAARSAPVTTTAEKE